MHSSALVLFSGGQDSATCLAHALTRYQRVETLAFDYGQRHRVELDQRLVVLAQLRRQFPDWAARMGDDHLLALPVLGQISEGSLTQEVAFQMEKNGLPNSFVPGRNLLFLTLAAALAYRRGHQVLVTGVCETDYSGYPDCRDDSIKAMQVALNLGMDTRIPAIWVSAGNATPGVMAAVAARRAGCARGATKSTAPPRLKPASTGWQTVRQRPRAAPAVPNGSNGTPPPRAGVR